jgi:hypothetical protein
VRAIAAEATLRGLVDHAVERKPAEQAVGGHDAQRGVVRAQRIAEKAQVVLAGIRAHRVGEVDHGLGRIRVVELAEGQLESAQSTVGAPGLLLLVVPRQPDGALDVVLVVERPHDLLDPRVLGLGEEVPLVPVGLQSLQRVAQPLRVVGEGLDHLEAGRVGDDHAAAAVADQPLDQLAGQLQRALAAGQRHVRLVEVEQVGGARQRLRGRAGVRERLALGSGGFRGRRKVAQAVEAELLDLGEVDLDREVVGGQGGEHFRGTDDGDVELGQPCPRPLDQTDRLRLVGPRLVALVRRRHRSGGQQSDQNRDDRPAVHGLPPGPRTVQ